MNFPDGFSPQKSTEISDFMKIRPVGAELLDGYRQTDMANLTVAFRSFGYAPKETFAWCLGIALSTYSFTSFGFFCTPLARSVSYIWQSEQRICNLHMK